MLATIYLHVVLCSALVLTECNSNMVMNTHVLKEIHCTSKDIDDNILCISPWCNCSRAKQISRRATGVPGRIKMSFYEPTDIDEKPRQPAKRSSSNVSSFNPPPSQPPPRLSSTSPRSKRRLSAEPEFPPSSGGSSENLSLPPQNEERKSRESSRQSSVNRLSGLSEDFDEQSNYEPIDSFIKERQKAESKVPVPQASQEDSPKSQRSSIVGAPQYPAPRPPPAKQIRSNREEDDDSDGYEPVQLAGQDEEAGLTRYRDEVERAVLPLRPGAMRVGGGRERSPTVSSTRVSSESPPRHSPMSSSVPANSILSGVGHSHLLRPPIKDKSPSPPKLDTKSNMPPMPVSPPPSPPVGRDVLSPPGRALPLSSPLEQPVLPPKKKAAKNPTYESRPSPPVAHSTVDESIYEFDRLSPPPATAPIVEAGSMRQAPPGVTTETVVQDDIYFDHLVSDPPPPPVPKKAHQPSLSSQTSYPDPPPKEDNVYFDHLASGPPAAVAPPPIGPKAPPISPRRVISSTSSQPIEDSVYFDHLATGPPTIPSKSNQSGVPASLPEDDQVYFDHLVQPVTPVQSVPGPRLPPQRQSSLTSDQKPSSGVKKPVSV